MITLLVGAALAYALWRIGDEMRQQRREAALQHLLATFAAAAAAAQQDPKQMVVWHPLAQASRKLFTDAFKELDAAAGGTFPFSREQVKAAHARCTADWLAWERAHDAEYSLKSAQVQDEIDRAQGPASPLLRTRLAAIEQQKLERYQQRYEEYIKTAKALAAFAE
jgi:type II secretory pathway pseudopilin PulG